ncbi:MAG: hypothetical protein GC151_14890 [Betaproteobacteria bacterium]|nr:hypothetical protein [Betaproteobacteria bacterium]
MRHLFLPVFLTGTLSLATFGVAHAANYPLGTMTCEDMGRFAVETMTAKQAGRSKQDALAALETRTYGDPVEKKNLTDVVHILYGNLGRNLSPKTAGAVIRSDCQAGRPK